MASAWRDPEGEKQIAKARRLLRGRPLPASVRELDIEYRPDSAGDPTLFVWLVVDEKGWPAQKDVDEWVKTINDLNYFVATSNKLSVPAIFRVKAAA